MSQEQILQLECKKHIKIFRLSQIGLPNKEIAALVKTNVGHVWNVLREYSLKTEKAAAANSL